MNASSTHLLSPGIQMHLKAALEFGASREELMEVLQLTSTVGIHASNVGVAILLDVLSEEGLGPSVAIQTSDAKRSSSASSNGKAIGKLLGMRY